MKKLRANTAKYFEMLDERWRILPIKKQHQYTLYFFFVYLLLTAGIIIKVFCDVGKPDNSIVIQSIETPVLKKKESPAVLQDSLSKILKNRIYE